MFQEGKQPSVRWICLPHWILNTAGILPAGLVSTFNMLISIMKLDRKSTFCFPCYLVVKQPIYSSVECWWLYFKGTHTGNGDSVQTPCVRVEETALRRGLEVTIPTSPTRLVASPGWTQASLGFYFADDRAVSILAASTWVAVVLQDNNLITITILWMCVFLPKSSRHTKITAPRRLCPEDRPPV